MAETWVWADGTIYDPELGGYREATPDELTANGQAPEELEQLHVEAARIGPLIAEAERLRSRVEWSRQTIATQREQLVDRQEAVDDLLRFLLKAGFTLPQQAVERDRLVEKYSRLFGSPELPDETTGEVEDMSPDAPPNGLTRRIDKILDRGGDSQERHAPCVVCGENFDDCQHSRWEVDGLIEMRAAQRQMERLT